MDDKRRAEIEENLSYAKATQRVQRDWRKRYISDVTDLLNALESQERECVEDHLAAGRLWEAHDELQQRALPAHERRTRDQIVGLVPDDRAAVGELPEDAPRADEREGQ